VVVIDARKSRMKASRMSQTNLPPFPEEKDRGREARRPRLASAAAAGAGARRLASSSARRLHPHQLHVVSDAEKFTVRLKAVACCGKMVAADELTDIAVLKIERRASPRSRWEIAMRCASAARLPIGRLSARIILHLRLGERQGRTNLLSRHFAHGVYEDYIQTDAFINPGNSGGRSSTWRER